MNPSEVIKRYKLVHIAAWLVLFLGWHFFRADDYVRYDRFGAFTPWLITLIKVVDLAIMVYITNYLLIPRLLYKKKYLLFVLSFIVLVFTSSLLKMLVEFNLMGWQMGIIWDNVKERIYDNVIPHFLLVSTGAAFKLLMDFAKAQRRLGEMAKEKAEAELNFLKSQINPHFLFNSLNSIYFLIDKKNTEARQTLLQFSDMLRYQLYDCNSGSIAIEKEVRFLEDYIRLQQLRKDQHYEVAVNVGNDVKGFSITPLLLIPLVENAFKHISHHNDARNFVHVELKRMNGTFTFTVENSKDDHHRTTEIRGGIGLVNVRRRLELLYPGKHELNIDNSETKFKVALNIHLS
jgi:two-component system, LytTR family, sensor kinase